MSPRPSPSAGVTLIEVLVGAVVGALILAGAFRLWKSNHEEGYRIQKKTELRDRMALASKRIQRGITLAGIGIARAPTLGKADAVGSDTLFVYTNEAELSSSSLSDLVTGQYAIHVANASAFQGRRFLAVSDGVRGEVRPIERVNGHVVLLSAPLEGAYAMASTTLYPARREAFFTDQGGKRLLRSLDGTVSVVAADIRNFQVSFRDRNGASTEDALATRTVHFSFTGEYPASAGALNSVVFTSTAIPRNVL